MNNKQYLGMFELKNIYDIQVLKDFEFSDKKNLMEVKVSSYYKKDILKNGFANGFSTEEVFQCGGPYWIYAPKEAYYKEKTITLKLNWLYIF